MTKYPIREPFLNQEHGDMLYSYRQYCQKIFKNQAAIDDSEESLKDIYTPLTLGLNDKTYDIEDVLLASQFLAISGPAGSGKSTITKYLSLILVQNGINDSIKKLGKRIVMPIILRELDFSKIHSLDDLFSSWIDRINNNHKKEPFTREFFDFYIKNGWVILIFDGFDEIGVEQNKNLVNWLIKYIDKHRLKDQEIKTNIVITGRPTAFTENSNQHSYFKKYEIEPYSDEQIEIYAKNYFTIRYSPDKNKIEEKCTNFTKDIKKSQSVDALKSRPVYLMMLAYTYDKNGELPHSRIRAYQLIVEAYIHYLDKEKNIKDSKLPDWILDDKLIMFEELAYKIHTKAGKESMGYDKSQMQIQIKEQDLKLYLKDIIQDDRLKSVDKDENIDKVLEYFVARTGLLAEPKTGYYQFSHLSFQEYLTASRIYRKVPGRKREEYLKKNLFDNLKKVGWAEIVLLYYGIDTLRHGEGQSDQIRFLFDEEDSAHHSFIINLISKTENSFSSEQKDKWLYSLLYIWVHAQDIYKFNTAINEFGKRDIACKSLFEDIEDDEDDVAYKTKYMKIPNYYLYHRNHLYLSTLLDQNIVLEVKKPKNSTKKYIEPETVNRILKNGQSVEVGKYQVTFEEYDKFCEDTGIQKPYDKKWGRGKRPVINISWIDAKIYCKWLNDKNAKEYRLPTSKEWEEIAQNGKDTTWGFGDDELQLKDYAWYSENSNNKTHKVGEKKSINGIYDMHGNVWEWCEDWNDKDKDAKVLRGGSWFNDAYGTRSSSRNWFNPANRAYIVGFRLLRTLPS